MRRGGVDGKYGECEPGFGFLTSALLVGRYDCTVYFQFDVLDRWASVVCFLLFDGEYLDLGLYRSG